MSTATPTTGFNLAEPIPGYYTKQRIGAGGYGEVWRAEAPGGIAKAIKIVYGYRDNERAERELKALNRIKEVRHPFVLSIERIELVDSHLVIVTELADSSLRVAFDEYRHRGQAGIPRAELLDYLRDASDALDHLSREHSLQHLDVKPENLLRMGGRVKVADFGLVKDLQDVRCSMISGLTPVYAAPELFDGRPNSRSDQYSLAIVYQEMLTGTPPFEGRTTAQLAAQHLHSRPRLDRLPASDQAIIARALSKDSGERFATCRAMIEALLAVTPNQRSAGVSVVAGMVSGHAASEQMPSGFKTELLSPDRIDAGFNMPSDTRSGLPLGPAPAVCDLPPLEIAREEVFCRPTVVVGLGGFGVKTVEALQRQLAGRFGELAAVPALQLLAFDTDAETLRIAAEGDCQSALGNDATVLLPLRPSADYRLGGSDHLDWLSRRWLFNIPRSLQTQGLRPLGRLAFVDHLDRVLDRLTRAIDAAVDAEALNASSRQTGLQFRQGSPRIFLISSITGGTGSGMVLDAAYLVRKILRDKGLAEEGLCGLLAYGWPRVSQGRDLAAANTYALLTELHHYSDLYNLYPGDPLRGLPAFRAEDAPFSHTYLLPLGDDLESADFLAAANQVAGYLYFNTVTPAAGLFDQCRNKDGNEGISASAAPTVRTFGFCQLGLSNDHLPATAGDKLCEALLLRWQGSGRNEPDRSPASFSDPEHLLSVQLSEGNSDEQLGSEVRCHSKVMGLEGSQIFDQIQAAAVAAIGGDAESYLLRVLPRLAGDSMPTGGSDLQSRERILDVLDTLIRSPHAQDVSQCSLESVLDKYLEQAAARFGATIEDWILDLAVSDRYGIQKALRAADLLVAYLRGLGREAGDRLPARRQNLAALRDSLLSEKNAGQGWLRSRGFGPWNKPVVERRLVQYFSAQVEELSLNMVCRMVGLVLGYVASVDDRLRNLAAELNRLAESFRLGLVKEHSPSDGSDIARQIVAKLIRVQEFEMVTEMDRRLEGLLPRVVVSKPHEICGLLPRVLRRTAHAVLLDTLNDLNLEKITASGEAEPRWPVFSLQAGRAAAEPRLLRCGGAKRLLLVVPEDQQFQAVVQEFSQQLAHPATVVPSRDNDVLVCCEAEQISLRRAAAAVIDRCPQIAELASRLHTRTDVPWSALS